MHMGIPRNVLLCGNTAVNLPIKEQFEEGLMTWKASLGNYFCTYEIIFKEIFQLLWRTQINRRSCHSQIEKRKKKGLMGELYWQEWDITLTQAAEGNLYMELKESAYIFLSRTRGIFLAAPCFLGWKRSSKGSRAGKRSPDKVLQCWEGEEAISYCNKWHSSRSRERTVTSVWTEEWMEKGRMAPKVPDEL